MVHRYRINKNQLLVTNDGLTEIGGEIVRVPILVSASTTTWVSGNTTVSNTVTFNQDVNLKNIIIPLEIKFEPMDNSELIENWVGSETNRVINEILDGEKVKYTNDNVVLDFRFLDRAANTYSNSYSDAGFSLPQDYSFNRFKKSYFRLYFYDGNTGQTSNLLFTEDFNTSDTITPSIQLRRLFWDKSDEIMDNTYVDRQIYMEARFFNAKTGQVHRFINVPLSYTSKISITEYSDPNNRGWRTSPITLINPNNSSNNYRFIPVNGIGANTLTKITMSEFILE